MKRVALFPILLCGLAGLAGCSENQAVTPSAPTVAANPATIDLASGTSAATVAAGVEKIPIAGTLDYHGEAPAGRAVITPSGLCHLWDNPVYDFFTGDLEGDVTFYEQGHGPCDYSRVSGSGPFEGKQITWNGRVGSISGQWTANCKPDVTQPFGVSCDGTMNARGSGGLEGVQFHFKWGPGWYPLPYTGTAIVR